MFKIILIKERKMIKNIKLKLLTNFIIILSLFPESDYAQNVSDNNYKNTNIQVIGSEYILTNGLQVVSNVHSGDTPVTMEAESGIPGSGFSILQNGAISYVTAKSNYSDLATPGDATRIITFQVTFEDSGNYNLFAHIYVGSGGFDDDSFFAGKGFGIKSVTNSADWVLINGLAGVGFFDTTDIVDAAGTAGSEVWKWVNITKNLFPADISMHAFSAPLTNLTQTFQIGSREDGLNIDKFSFGKIQLYFTVDELNKGLAGSATKPVIDLDNFYKGPALAQGLTKFLGNVMASDHIFANYWNQITPGNEGKWGSIASSSDTLTWNWSGLDAIYNYAINHNLIFKDHTLIWGSQQPTWISSLGQTQQLKYIETWIRQVGQRYSKIDMIDVVNEALPGHNPPDGQNSRANYKNALGGDGNTGWDWVINAFVMARKYLPDTKLLINDYGIINDNTATTTYLTIINLLKDRGLIDGIGVQGHRFELEKANTTTLINNLDRLYATGLPIYISEMDLGNLDNAGVPDDNQQLQLYQKIFPVLWSHPGVKGITLWGYVEGEMWQSSCYLVLKNGTWRPALTWLAQYIKDNTPAATNEIEYIFHDDITLEQNYPNPFSTSTEIIFSMAEPANVSLKIYNNLGIEVATLVDGYFNPGKYSVNWNTENSSGSEIKEGIYYCKLIAGKEIIVRKMLLIK